MEEGPKIEKENIIIEVKENEASAALRDNIDVAIKAETEKTPEQIKLVEKANEYLNEELKELGIEKKSSVLPEKVHLIPEDLYKKVNNSPQSAAFVSRPGDDIFFNEDMLKDNKSALFFYLTHELIHLASFEGYLIDDAVRDDSEKGNVLSIKTGYQTTKFSGGEKQRQFKGLNEMVANKISHEIITKHRKELKNEFKTSKNMLASGDTYFLEILDMIINDVAIKNDEKKEDVWTRFKKGLFTGEMMHLRDVEKVCGKGALRILAAYHEEKTEENKELFGKVVDYFVTKDEEKREKIAEGILPENEFKKYKQQRKES